MKYAKPSLSVEQQAALLIDRGMLGDKDELVKKLSSVSYYRLTAYWYPFRLDDDSFRENTKFDTVWNRYTFDRHLRLLLIDAIERIEVSVRTHLTTIFSKKYGPFAYAEVDKLPALKEEKHKKFLRELNAEVDRSREDYISHFKRKYSDEHAMPPLWMLAELMSFGKTLTLFNGCERPIRTEVSRSYGVSAKVFKSWLLTINVVRNYCAHHARVWNRVIGLRPIIPEIKNNLDWHSPSIAKGGRIYGVLTIMRYLMDIIAPQSSWSERFQTLLDEYPHIPIEEMGFPKNWKSCPIWSGETR